MGLSREGGNVPNMASVLRASREERVQVQAAAEPRPLGGMTTSSTAPMPKALPRRPNLLALFPGISNDWRGAERYTVEGERAQKDGKRERETKEAVAGGYRKSTRHGQRETKG